MTGLRLAMGPTAGRDLLDGGWWPRSRDLATEFADLVADFPAEYGRVVRAVYSPPDWDDSPRRVPVATGYVKVGKFPQDDTHLIHLRTSDRRVLRLLVVPSAFNEAQGAEALLASATPGNHHAAGDLLDVVTNERAVDPDGLWAADGEE